MTGNKSSQSCPDCKATPTQIKANAVHIFENVKNLEWLKKGAKSLHNLPRSMEFLINAGAKIRIGKNRVSTDLDKAMRDEDEEKIKDLLEARYGIRPGQVTSKGGNTNTGNLARKVFSDPEYLAEVTGVPLVFVKRLINLTIIARSGQMFDWREVKKYCERTREIYVECGLGFKSFCPTVHQLVDHLWMYVRYSPVPLGLLSEEPLECSNKNFREFR